jgi:hypothetical protein
LQGKKIAPKQIDPDLPETLPGRKYVLFLKTFPLLACLFEASLSTLDKGELIFNHLLSYIYSIKKII